jgi:hypothetical protein
MITDSKLNFSAPGSPLSIVAAAGVDILFPGIIDLLGNGVGTPVTNHFGTSTLPGQADAHGVGQVRPELVIAMGTAATAGTSTPTLNVQLQGAPDDGSNNPGTWQTLGETGALTVAQLVAGQIIGRLPWLPPFPQNLRPRFLRLNGDIPAGTAFGAGTIAYATVTTVRDDPFQMQAAKAYSLGPLN